MFDVRESSLPGMALPICAALVMALSLLGLAIGSGIPTDSGAWADEIDDIDAKIEETGAAYDAAVAETERISAEIESLEGQIREQEGRLPGLEEQANQAAVSLYKFDDSLLLLDMLLNAKSVSDAVMLLDSYGKVLDHYADAIHENKSVRASLEDNKAKLGQDKEAADKAVEEAEDALEAAKEAREEAQARAAAKAAQAAAESASALAAEINWNMSKDEFIKHWGARIDAYFSSPSRPLAGYGEEFAEAAWDAGCDPRWSAAISVIESGGGDVCFASYNPFGWMSHSFSSWEEAIHDHAEYLAGPLYGGYLTPAAADTYCPGGTWYGKVYAEMKKI